MSDERASQFLNLIRRAQRGRLKIYLGYGPGVGKTTLMLQEGHRLKADGIDVVVGLVETHGRAGTAQFVEGLEVIPRRRETYHGIDVDEMDVAAILARHPQVVLVDELAHTNVPGSRNDKRHQDVQDLLAAGIHVITTLNVQHLESLYDTVERLVQVRVRERLPDSVLAAADQVVNVDLAPEDLQQRLRAGSIYPQERVPAALEHYFKAANLEQLRELTLRELAAQIDFRRREVLPAGDTGAPDQVMVCLSSRGPNSARLLRFASRLAGRLNRTWYAVYVQTPGENPLTIDAATQRHLAGTLTLANQLGAMVFTFTGEDVVQTIVRFAREYRVGHLVIGKPRPAPWWARWWRKSVAERLLGEAQGLTVVVVDVAGAEAGMPMMENPRAAVSNPTAPPVASAPVVPTTVASTPVAQAPGPREPARDRHADDTAIAAALGGAERIVVWQDQVAYDEVIGALVRVLAAALPGGDMAPALAALAARERQGSTSLNDGLALPHARLPGLRAPLLALGLTRAGLGGDPSRRIVALLLSPEDEPGAHLRLLAAISRRCQDRDLRRRLENAGDSAAAWREVSGPGH
jgi:two-component system sensor histidine kinase KdpD